MAKSLLQLSRSWHRTVASLLFIFFLLISITGIMLGWKSIFSKIIYDNKKIQPSVKVNQWLAIDSLEKIATVYLNSKTGEQFEHAERIELRTAKGYINIQFKKYYSVQMDGASGGIIHIEQKTGGFIQDLHDGAIIDTWANFKSGIAKKTYTSFLGLALLFLTISGVYLWWKPKQIKQKR